MYRLLASMVLVMVVFAACKKAEDKVGAYDDRLSNNTYCNEPSAVNYNWGFPGKPDNSICFYPTEVFKGSFLLADSTFDVNYAFTGVRSVKITLSAADYSHMSLTGFCNDNTALAFTADKFFRASADTTILVDSVKYAGQLLCRPVDTLSGYLSRERNNDSFIRINFTIVSDTGVSYHIGTAIKQ
ncbi:MAG: hypothetical protein EOP51_05070 [Sphingobacteriales bacterium]|nr:MAG: hypothetical protein EOP51_05070 [Sphingobacteriales bacterium]